MAGIYIHIPFCKQACHYCDFHFSTSQKTKPQVLEAIAMEIEQRESDFSKDVVSSIYFGGGTPSILSEREIEDILKKITENYKLAENTEITLECNPDDLDEDKLKAFLKLGINRLSIGVQSFYDHHLKFMNRAHRAKEAIEKVQLAQKIGFENITIDLIYGIPEMRMEEWKNNILRAIELNVQHVSAYCLTVEKGTALHHFVKTGQVKPELPEVETKQYLLLREMLEKEGFIAYEVSNFGKENFFSRHNSSYWKGMKYLGVGPSAHSFDGIKRRWNVAQNVKYSKAVETGVIPFEEEILSVQDQCNEYIMTRLRTHWGIDIKWIQERYQPDFYERNEENIREWLRLGWMNEEKNIFKLTATGMMQADRLASELFWID